MRDPSIVSIDDFRGVAGNVHPVRMNPSMFQTDKDGDLFRRGSWRCRRGMSRISLTSMTYAVDTVFGLRTVTGDLALGMIDSSGAFKFYNTTSGTARSGSFSNYMRVTAAEHNGYVYFANGWDNLRRWGGDSARRSWWNGSDEFEDVPIAGIDKPERGDAATGPWAPAPTEGAASGDGWTAGTHTFRYRYMDSRTGYVSNPSDEADVTVSAASKKLTFNVEGSGSADQTDIVRPQDDRADTIVLEATLVGGSEFFKVGEFSAFDSSGNGITTLVAEISDEELAGGFLTWDDSDDSAPGFGHSVPPVKRYVASGQGRLWLFGSAVYSGGTIAVTNNSTTVTGSNTNFTESALGTTALPPTTGRRLLRTQEQTYYEIENRASASSITLAKKYTGSTNSGLSYEIVDRNRDIYVSRVDYPESFPPDSFISLPGEAGSGQVTAGVALDSSMLFFTNNGAYLFGFSSEPKDDGFWTVIPGNRGAVSQQVVVTHGGRVYSLDRQGFWMYSGGVPNEIGSPVESIHNSLAWSYSGEWFGVYLPRLKAIRWYVTPSGASINSYYLQYNLETGAWTHGSNDNGLCSGATVCLSASGAMTAISGDEYGNVFYLDSGTTDGATAATSSHTVTTASTTTVVKISGGLNVNDDYKGAWLYWLQGGESRRISSHDANGFTVSSAFSQAPASTDTVYAGQINCKLKSKAFIPSRTGMQGSFSGRYLRFGYKKLSSSKYLAVRFYKDLSSTAMTWSVSSLSASRANVLLPGSVTGYASSDWIVDLSLGDGYAEIPIGMEDFRVLEFEFEVIQPNVDLEIWGVELEGFEARGDL